jgi:hypothetical protein
MILEGWKFSDPDFPENRIIREIAAVLQRVSFIESQFSAPKRRRPGMLMGSGSPGSMTLFP